MFVYIYLIYLQLIDFSNMFSLYCFVTLLINIDLLFAFLFSISLLVVILSLFNCVIFFLFFLCLDLFSFYFHLVTAKLIILFFLKTREKKLHISGFVEIQINEKILLLPCEFVLKALNIILKQNRFVIEEGSKYSYNRMKKSKKKLT